MSLIIMSTAGLNYGIIKTAGASCGLILEIEMQKLLDRALAAIGLQRVNNAVLDRDQLIFEMRENYSELGAPEFEVLKRKWREEFAELKRLEGGCGHGLVRFPYERDFTPCHCGRAPA